MGLTSDKHFHNISASVLSSLERTCAPAARTFVALPQKKKTGKIIIISGGGGEAGVKRTSFSASSVRFKLSVSYVSTAKFINAHFMQSLSSQAQTV